MSTSPPLVVADRYRLVAPLGQGGMGRVWRATDVVLHRDVAIKELVPPPGLTADERREMRERSLREARAIARLNNINVVRVFDVLRTDADPWIVMEYVPSRSLQDTLASDGPFPPVRAAEIGLGVLNALRAAHRNGVVHRDVKPGNVLLGPEGRVVLTDFGLATVPGDPNVTRTGLVLGSPAYIAPERARDGTAGPAADMWSLGATLYAAVEGQSPFARPTAIATLAALATENPPPARNAGPLKPALNGLLRKDPTHRINAEEAERLLLRAAGRRSRLAFPMSPTMRRPGVGRERPALSGPGQPPVIPGTSSGPSTSRPGVTASGSAPVVPGATPVVPGPRPPISTGRPPSTTDSGRRPPVFTPGKASVGRPAAESPPVEPPRMDATRVDAPAVRGERGPGKTMQGTGTGAAEAAENLANPATSTPGSAALARRGAFGTISAAEVAAFRARRAAESDIDAADSPKASSTDTADAPAGAVVASGAVADAPARPVDSPDPDIATPGAPSVEAPEATAVTAPADTPEAGAVNRVPAAGGPIAEAGPDADVQPPSQGSVSRDVITAPTAQDEPTMDGNATVNGTATDGRIAADGRIATGGRTATDRPAPKAAEHDTTTEGGKAAEQDKTAEDRNSPDSAAPAAHPEDEPTGKVRQHYGNKPAVGARAGASGSKASRKKGRGRNAAAATAAAATAAAAAIAAAAKDTPRQETEPDAQTTPEAAKNAAHNATEASETATEHAAQASETATEHAAQASETATEDAAQASEAAPTAAAPASKAAPADTAPQVPETATAHAAETSETPDAATEQAPVAGKAAGEAEVVNLTPTTTTTKIAAARSGDRRVVTAPAPIGDTATESAAGTAVLNVPMTRPGEERAKEARRQAAPSAATRTRTGDTSGTPAGGTGFTAPSRPAWQPMAVPPRTDRKGLTVFGTTLTRRQAIIGIAVLVALLVALVLLVPLAFRDGDQDNAGNNVAVPPPASAAATSRASAPAAAPTAASKAPTSTSPSSAPAQTSAAGFTPPSGWYMYRDRSGFSVPLPNGVRPSAGNANELHFRWNNRLLIIAQTDQPQPDPYKDWQQQERDRAGDQYRNYRKIRLERVDYQLSAADWEFTYTTSNGNAQHAVKRNFLSSKTQAYSINWYTSPGDWDAAKKDIQVIYQGFVPRK